jgi:hypothetical protein
MRMAFPAWPAVVRRRAHVDARTDGRLESSRAARFEEVRGEEDQPAINSTVEMKALHLPRTNPSERAAAEPDPLEVDLVKAGPLRAPLEMQ